MSRKTNGGFPAKGDVVQMAEVESYQLTFKKTTTPRVAKLFEQAVNAEPSLCVERARYFTRSWKETEGLPYQIRRARAVEKVVENMTVYILEGELIVGNVATKPRGSIVAPEYQTTILHKELLDPVKAPDIRPYDRMTVSREAKEELMNDILPYWMDKTIEYHSMREMSRECVNAALSSESEFETAPAGTEIHMRHGAGHLNAGYSKIITRGARSIINEAAERMRGLREDETDKREFYEAVIIVYEAFIKYARRYAGLAMEQASTEKDPVRKKELFEIAERCRWVPEHPARTFIEAVQATWFTQQFVFGIEQEDTGCSPGRMDQYLYPFYQADREAGRLTDDDAQEIIELFFIKCGHMSIAFDYATARYYAGFSLTQTITVGGVDKRGNDATNELSYMFLEAEAQVPLFQPEFAARIHKNSPFEYLKKIAEVSRLGHGKPKMFVDEVAVPAMLSRGVTLEEARDYCIVGCVEPSPSGNMCGWTNAVQFNLAKCMELVMTQGVCLLTGKRMGPKTQDPATFKNMDDVVAALREQVRYFVKLVAGAINTYVKYHGIYATNPFTSATLEGCLESGADMIRGGAKYKAIGINGVAVPDVGDSLAALDKVVFRDRKYTMEQIVEALKADFEGYGDIRHDLLYNAPKYGNDIDFADRYARMAGQLWCEEAGKFTGPHGERYFPGAFTVSSNVPHGMQTGALPSGRKAGEPLANGGISATNGSDTHGPTALIKSAVKVDSVAANNGTLLNMRFSPSVLKEERDIIKFANFLRAYCLAGGYHIQFNVVSSSLLKKAQVTPGQYKNLLIRVAGYSAYYTELSKEVQDDLIARTEYDEV
jgi:formate C-acetyltransferase